MKKLEKLAIKFEKVINDQELVKLRGGGYEDLAQIRCYNVYQELLGCVNTPYCPAYSTQKSMCKSSYTSTYTAVCENHEGYC